MWSFLRRYTNYFLLAFLVTFIIYLFIRFDPDEVLLGVAIAAGVGFVVCILLLWLERRFPDRAPPQM
ncbi:MAG: hypothetical protein ACR2HN_10525 [Tepidiformaceae bacterium]